MKATDLFLLCLLSGHIMAQNIPEKNCELVSTCNFNDSKIETMTMFNYKFYNNKVYFQWTVKGELSDCLYIVEKSVNNKDFKRVGIVKGFGVVNTDIDILYCFTDNEPSNNISYYRVKQLLEAGDVRYSDVKIFENPTMKYVADYVDKN